MIVKKGDIWSYYGHSNNYIVIPTNNVVGANGLVMGAGLAAQAAQRVPELPNLMKSYGGIDYLSVCFPRLGIICLQTKRDWKDPSPIDLVEQSIKRLAELGTRNDDDIFHCPKFGCGLGNLSWDKQVEPLCTKYLPNERFVIWEPKL